MEKESNKKDRVIHVIHFKMAQPSTPEELLAQVKEEQKEETLSEEVIQAIETVLKTKLDEENIQTPPFTLAFDIPYFLNLLWYRGGLPKETSSEISIRSIRNAFQAQNWVVTTNIKENPPRISFLGSTRRTDV